MRDLRQLLEIFRAGAVGALVGGLAAGPGAGLALAGPELQEVVQGSVGVEVNGLTTDLNVTDGSIANYSSFDILANELVNVNVEIDGGSHLARVISLDPTQIDGSLFSNGQVYLINPAGVYFGKDSSVRAAGLHAGAGKIEGFGPEGDGLVDEVRYFDLEGTVENLGSITADIVELVGRHVVNAGSLRARGADGFFVLVVGDDVTIVRETGVDGEFSVSVTIEGLAHDVVAAAALETTATHSHDPRTPDELVEGLTSSLEAGDGQIVMAVGAGDLVGAAIHYAGTANARQLTLLAEGGDVVIDGTLTAHDTALCAGSTCFDAQGEGNLLGDPVVEDGESPRAAVVLAGGALLAPETRLDPDTSENIAPLLRVQQDGDLLVDDGLALAPGAPLAHVELQSSDDLEIASDRTQVGDPRADLAARTLSARAGADGSGTLRLGMSAPADDPDLIRADEIALQAGERIGVFVTDAEVLIGEAVRFAAADDETAAPQSFRVRQDADVDAENVASAEQFGSSAAAMIYEVRSDKGSVRVDEALSARLTDSTGAGRNQEWDLLLEALFDVTVEADLQARRLELHAAAATMDPDGDEFAFPARLTVGSEDTQVTLSADEILLHAGDRGLSNVEGFRLGVPGLAAEVNLVNTPQFRSTPGDPAGDRAPDVLTIQQDAAIGFNEALWRAERGDPQDETFDESLDGVVPTLANFGADAALLPDDGLDLRLQVDGDESRLRLDEDDVEARQTLFDGSNLTLATGPELIRFPEIDVLADQLRARSLTLESLTRSNVKGGLLATTGDLTLIGDVVADGEGAQRFESEEGRVVGRAADVGGEVIEKTGGDLVLASAAVGVAIDMGLGLSVEDGDLVFEAPNGTLDLDRDVEVTHGNLTLDRDFTVERDLTVTGGELRIESQGRFDGFRQTVSAPDLIVTGQIDKPTGGELILHGTESLRIDSGDAAAPARVRSELLRLQAGSGEVEDGAAPAHIAIGQAELEAEDFSFVQQADVRLGDPSDPGQGGGLGAFTTPPDKYTAHSTEGEVRVVADTTARDITLRGETVVFAPGARLLDTDGSAPDAVTIHTETVLDVAGGSTDFRDLDALFGTVDAASPLAYTLRSDGDVLLDQDFVPSDSQADGLDLSLVAGNDVSLLGDVTARSISAQAAGNGAGALLLGVVRTTDADGAPILEDAAVQPRLSADAIDLVASAPAAQGAAEVRIGSGVTFSDRTADEPLSFRLAQDAAITDEHLPQAAQFSDGVADIDYEIESFAGSVTIDAPEQVTGANLTLAGSAVGTDVRIGSPDELAVASLHVRDVDGDSEVVFAGDVNATGDILIESDARFEGSDANRQIQAGGDLHLARNLSYQRDDAGGLRLLAVQQLRVDGEVLFRSKVASSELMIAAATATLDDVQTVGGSDEAPDITLTAEQLTLRGDVRAGSVGSVRGNVSITASGAPAVQIGSDMPLTAEERVELFGRAVSIEGSVGTTVSELPEDLDGVLRTLAIDASGDVSVAGDVAVDDFEVEADGGVTLDALDIGRDLWLRASDGITVAGDVHAGSARLEAGGDGSGDLVLDGQSVAASEIFLEAGSRKEGDHGEHLDQHANDGQLASIQLAEGLVFTSRDGPSAPDRLELVHEPGFDEQAVLDVLARVPSLDDARARGMGLGLVSYAGEVAVGEADGQSVLNNLRVALGGAIRDDSPTVTMAGDVHVRSLDLESRASLAGSADVASEGLRAASDLDVGGDLRVAERLAGGSGVTPTGADGRSAAGGLRVGGDLSVLGDLEVGSGVARLAGETSVFGDVDLTTVASFTSEDAQSLFASGSLRAPELVKIGPDLDLGTGGLRVTTGGAIDLTGSLGLGPARISSADIKGGAFELRPGRRDNLGQIVKARVTLGGDVLASGDIDLRRPDGAPVDVVLDGVSDQRLFATEGAVRADVSITKEIGRRPEDRSLVLGGGRALVQNADGSLSGGAYEIRGDVSARTDLTLVGEGQLLEGNPVRDTEGNPVRDTEGNPVLRRSVTAQEGTLTLGSFNEANGGGVRARDASELVLSGAQGISIQSTGTDDDPVLVVGQKVRVDSAVSGPGNLIIDVREFDGRIVVMDDVQLDASGALELRSSAEQGIVFAKDGSTLQTIEAGRIRLNPDGREPTSLATIVRDDQHKRPLHEPHGEGDLRLAASSGSVEVGTGEVVTVAGELSVSGSEALRLPHVNALALDLSAPLLVARTGSTGADWNANQLTTSGAPRIEGTGSFVIGTPTTAEVSASLVSEGQLLRALKGDQSPLTRGDLVASSEAGQVFVDFTPTGSARYLAAEQFDTPLRQIKPLSYQALAHLNTLAREARPLLADEVVDHLELASVGGAFSRSAGADDPRFDNASIDAGVDVYRGVFAPTAHFDEATGGSTVRSHAPRIREVLSDAWLDYRLRGGAADGRAFAARLENTRGGEALFYLSNLQDLVLQALRGGLDPRQAERFAMLLARDVTPEGVDPWVFGEALLPYDVASSSAGSPQQRR